MHIFMLTSHVQDKIQGEYKEVTKEKEEYERKTEKQKEKCQRIKPEETGSPMSSYISQRSKYKRKKRENAQQSTGKQSKEEV